MRLNKTTACFTVLFTLLLNSMIAFSQDSIWQNVNLQAQSKGQASLIHLFDANDQLLRTQLSRAPNEVRGTSDTIHLPMPDGRLAKFSVVESSNMEDGLAEEFPQIKSYKVHGIDDPSASGRVDMSPNGFRGMLMTSRGRVFIDPINDIANPSRYLSKFRTTSSRGADQPFQCDVHRLPGNSSRVFDFSRRIPAQRVSGSLTSYRIAVSATSEYVTAVGGTLEAAMSEINTAINRVNQIFEGDLGIHLNLITTNSSIIEVAPADFGFSNNNVSALLNQNQTQIDTTIENSNYDIGHVFGTRGGGVAGLRVACNDDYKAWGVTGLKNPTGDPFYIDYVAHEIGHQFGGNHSYNGSNSNCANRNASTAFEPGSGSSIMGYAGLCIDENISNSTDATFHAGSIAEINSFVTGAGGTCATSAIISPANSDPTNVNAGIDRVIPINTPFRLTASAVDTGDTLSYQWDQMDVGAVATTSTTIGTDQGNNPLFRTGMPKTTSTREFPVLMTQINNISTKGETLPTKNRVLNFRVTVRDGRAGQGTDDVQISVDTTSGPFAITSHNAELQLTATDGTTVEWNPANTPNAPVNCPSVDIKLYTFSEDKSSYGIVDLLLSTDNDGSQFVDIPDKANAQARFSVSCSNNIFYDLSNFDLNIMGEGIFSTTGYSTGPSKATLTQVITTTPASTDSGGGGGGSFTLATLLLTLLLWLKRYSFLSQKVYRPLSN